MENKDKIRAVREALKLTQAAFAKEVGVAGNYIGMVERGAKPATDKLARQVQTHFNVRLSWWESGEGEMFSNKFQRFAAHRQEEMDRQRLEADEIARLSVELEAEKEKLSTAQWYRMMSAIHGVIEDMKKEREDKQ